jgi:hypothetical protein
MTPELIQILKVLGWIALAIFLIFMVGVGLVFIGARGSTRRTT